MAVERVVLHAANVGASVLSGMTRGSVKTQSEIDDMSTDGEPWANMLFLREQKPGMGFTTTHIAEALGLIGVTGADIANMVGGLILNFALLELGATKAAGAVHRKYTATEGLVLPRRLTADHARPAELEYEAFCTYDGTNDPFVISDTGSLPSLTAAERFGLGPTTIGGITLQGKTRIVLDFAGTENFDGVDGEPWPDWVHLQDFKPTLRIEGVDRNWWKATGGVPLTGLAATHANSTIYLRKYINAGTFHPDASLVHISLTVDGLAVAEDHEATGTDPSQVSLNIPLRHDGTNLPIVVSTGVALPP